MRRRISMRCTGTRIRLRRYNKCEAMLMILRISKPRVSGPHLLLLTFNDGTTKTVNVLPLLEGPVFEPLKDPSFFARAVLDPISGTAAWPNGADLAPEAPHELSAVEEARVA